MAALIFAVLFAGLKPANARSKAASWLINEQIIEGCGKAGFDAVIKTDLTGDGQKDLIIDHGGLECVDAAIGSRSNYCGIRACSVLVYVRVGDLLKLKLEVLSIGVSISSDNPPRINLMGHNFEENSIVWTGTSFQ